MANADMVLQCTAHILEPLVALLLAQGVTYPQLAETMKIVFINIAAREFSTDIRRINDSNLSMTTGIHRKDIKRLRKTIEQPRSNALSDMPKSLSAAVFTHWMTNSFYCDPHGQPKALPQHGGENSFEGLVRCISKDVHSRTVLNELLRLGMVIEEEETVRLKTDAFVPNPDFAQMLGYLRANLHDHAAAATHNIQGKGPAFLEQSIFSDAIPKLSVEEIATLVRQEWKQLVKKTVPAVAHQENNLQEQQDPAQSTLSESARIRFGMYFFAESNK